MTQCLGFVGTKGWRGNETGLEEVTAGAGGMGTRVFTPWFSPYLYTFLNSVHNEILRKRKTLSMGSLDLSYSNLRPVGTAFLGSHMASSFPQIQISLWPLTQCTLLLFVGC